MTDLKKVQQNGLALEYVKEQTKDICLAAVKQNGYALIYVKEQTPELCLVAVQQNGLVLEFVKEQTSEICLAAVQQNGCALQYVKEEFKEYVSSQTTITKLTTAREVVTVTAMEEGFKDEADIQIYAKSLAELDTSSDTDIWKKAYNVLKSQ